MAKIARRLFAVITVTSIVLLGAMNTTIAQAESGTPLKVLFIGNSYTSVNNLPGMLAGLADAAGGRKIETDRHLFGGCTLERHVKEKKAIEKIKSKKWDVVVLQEQSLMPVIAPQQTLKYARILAAEIKQQGAKPVFYLTWARQHIPEMQSGADPDESPAYAKAMYNVSGAGKFVEFEAWLKSDRTGLKNGLNGTYFAATKETNATVAPVGIAWENALAADPDLVLHQRDKSHPSQAGSYLAACVFYATLLKKSPIGLPGAIKQGKRTIVNIPADQAKQLQQIAWDTVKAAQAR